MWGGGGGGGGGSLCERAILTAVSIQLFLRLKRTSSVSWGSSPMSFLTQNTCSNIRSCKK